MPKILEATATRGWDIVLSDYNLPTFSGPEALQVKQAMGLDIPFIIASPHDGTAKRSTKG